MARPAAAAAATTSEGPARARLGGRRGEPRLPASALARPAGRARRTRLYGCGDAGRCSAGCERARHGHHRRRPPRQLLRARVAGSWPASWRRPVWSSSAASPSASMPAPTAARSKPPGSTVAVLGCGPDVAYPAAHRSLWRRICELGLVLSELPPGTGAWRWTFPARNRIMAALAGMTVVVEAAERSGSLITADLAATSAATSAPCRARSTSRASAGPNDLLAGGACVVRDAQDVLDAMLGPGARALERVRAAAGAGSREASSRRSSGARRRCDGDRRRARPLRRARPPRRWPASSSLGYLQLLAVGIVRCGPSQAARRLALGWPDDRPDRSRRSSRSPARTPAAAPGSRPT